MKTHKRTSGWRSLPASLVAICCLLIVGAGSSPGRLATKLVKKPGERPPTHSTPVVVGGNLKLEIVEINEVAKELFHVTIKNGYAKDITAIAATAGEEQSFRTDYIYAELESHQKLASGASDDFSYSPSRLAGVLPQVVVAAVIFTDGTSEGDQREVTDIVDNRLGLKIQLNRINRYLERLRKSENALVRNELRSLRGIAEGLRIDNADGSPMSRGFEQGLRHGRAFILSSISKLETVIENETTESFYQNGVLQTVRRSGDENFRRAFPRVEKDFKR